MTKIVRYNGNLQAFASAAPGTERTLFGDVAQADDLTSQINADFLRGWGIVGPSDQPTLQDFNAMGYALGQLLAYLHQAGVPEYNATQEYFLGSIVPFGGELYTSLQNANIGNVPDASPAAWSPVALGMALATDTGAANAHVLTTDTTIQTLSDKTVIRFKATSSNTGAATANVNGTGAKAIVGGAHLALQGGEIISTGEVILQYNTSVGGGSWVIVDSGGGSPQVPVATKANHSVNLNEFISVLATTGYFKIPVIAAGVKRTLIFQWVSQAAVGTGGLVSPFSIAFPTQVLIEWATLSVSAGPLTQFAAAVSPPSLTTIQTVVNTGTAAVAAFAIGF